MKVVVCDASPLVFLAKVDQLSLISSVLGGSVFVLRCIAREVLSESAGPQARARLNQFPEQVQVVDVEDPRPSSRSLSRSDLSVLLRAVENRANWLVGDERMLRRIAGAEGVRVVGFLGLVITGAQREILSRSRARLVIDDAISKHGCRISIDLYRRLLAELGYGGEPTPDREAL